MGTPSGFSQASSRAGQLVTGLQKRELGWAAGVDEEGRHGLPRQSMQLLGFSPIPSHHTPPSGVRATLLLGGDEHGFFKLD